MDSNRNGGIGETFSRFVRNNSWYLDRTVGFACAAGRNVHPGFQLGVANHPEPIEGWPVREKLHPSTARLSSPKSGSGCRTLNYLKDTLNLGTRPIGQMTFAAWYGIIIHCAKRSFVIGG